MCSSFTYTYGYVRISADNDSVFFTSNLNNPMKNKAKTILSAIYHFSIYLFPGRLLQIASFTFILIAACNSANIYADENKGIELEPEVLNGLQSGQYVILLRHALAPGLGDPDYFDINDCSTQRNLSERGRQQAQHIGKLLKTKGIQHATVYSSQWCRCLDTARLLDFGEVSELPIINSFFQRTERREQQTQDLKNWLIEHKASDSKKPTTVSILVTHQVNITALSDIFPRSGELVVIDIDRSGSVSVVRQWETDN